MTTIAIMQPYFVPYAGYFRLFAAADRFVIYDCVQFPRRGWVHRNRLPDAAGRLHWLTLPLAKAPREARIDALGFAADAEARLDAALERFPALRAANDDGAELMSLVRAIGQADPVGYLERLLQVICRRLGLERPMLRSSTLGIDPSLHGEARILAICAALGARRYVNSPGGRALYDAERFARRGVELRFLDDYPGSTASILYRLLTEPVDALRREIEAASASTR
jgi:hypothetical protein